MNEGQPTGDAESRYDELAAQVASLRADIGELQARADESTLQADTNEARATAQSTRMDDLEARIDIDRAVIAQLQADGLLSEEHAAHLEAALRSSRRIGAAIGLVMADRHVNEADAFVVLSKASQYSNRKLRLLAEDLVREGGVSSLPDA